MKKQILIPDSSVTEEIDIWIEQEIFNLGIAQQVRNQLHDSNTEDIHAADEEIKRIENEIEDLEESKDTNPKITIGYMPPAKKTELIHRWHVLTRKKDLDQATEEDLIANEEIAREFCKWGVKGHANIPKDFELQKIRWNGKEYDIASDLMVAIYEANQWHHIIKNAVIKYNTLQDSKKKR